MESDLQLVHRYAESRDAEAFSTLVGRYQDFVYATCLRIVGERAEAEDAAQECFISLARNAGVIRSSLSGWLHHRATSLSIDAVRRNHTRLKREMVYGEMKDAQESDGTLAEVAPALDRALEELPEEARHLLVEHFLLRRTQAELAEEKGVSPATISRQIASGVEELRCRLKRMGIIAGSAVLLTLLGKQAACAAPPTVTVSLGKIALVGFGNGTSATAVSSTATVAGVNGIKTVGIGLIAAGAITAGTLTSILLATSPAQKGTAMVNQVELLTRAFMMALSLACSPPEQQDIRFTGCGIYEDAHQISPGLHYYKARRTDAGFAVQSMDANGKLFDAFTITRKADGIYEVTTAATGAVEEVDLKRVDSIWEGMNGEPRSFGIGADGTRITTFDFGGDEKAGPAKRVSIVYDSRNISFTLSSRKANLPAKEYESLSFAVAVDRPTAEDDHFGPVKELTIHDFQSGKECLADLDSGSLFLSPNDKHPKENLPWIAQTGIDLMCVCRPDQGDVRGLTGFAMQAIPVSEEEWQKPPLSALKELKLLSPPLEAVCSINDGFSGARTTPATYLFNTREGAVGVLQLLEVSEEMTSVKFRYKLMKGDDVRVPRVAGIFGPEVELTIDDQSNGPITYLDLDSGRPALPDELRGKDDAEVMYWFRRAGKDGLGILQDPRNKENGVRLLICQGVQLAQIDNKAFDEPPIAQLEQLRHVSPQSMAITILNDDLPGENELPATFLFHTREGAAGVLQLMEFVKEGPPQVRLRYKLLR